MNPYADVRENYLQILEQVEFAAKSAGRDPREVRLVVVTKGHPLEAVEAVFQAGGRDLGENYAEEGAAKMKEVQAGTQVQWHMIGHIQSRKAELVAAHFDYCHALDSTKLARRLDRACAEHNRCLPVLIELNVSGEQSKFGWRVENEVALEGIFDEIEQVLELPHLEVRGLMTIAPYAEDAEQARPSFRRLRQYRDLLAAHFPTHCWEELSMGMSGDFVTAIQEGATWVRIGTAILGARPAIT